MAEEYDGTIHEGQTAEVLIKREKQLQEEHHNATAEYIREFIAGQIQTLRELSQPPEGWKPPCKTCGGTGEIPDLIPITIMGKELPGNPCPDCIDRYADPRDLDLHDS